MDLHIDFESETPIYTQLYEQIVTAIAKGDLKAGNQLPSVRRMAEDLDINLHTVNKVYSLLKDDGYLTMDRRNGTVVSAPARGDEAYMKALAKKLMPIASEARCKGLSRKDFRRICGEVYDELKGEKE